MQRAASSFTQPPMPSGRSCNKLGGLHRRCTNARSLCCLAKPSSHCHIMILMETRSIYIQSLSTVHEEHEERANVQVRHNYAHKAKPQELPFHVFQLNPLPLEAEHLNCGKAVIFKLAILVISEGSNNVIKLTSIRTLSPSCFTTVSMLLTADMMLLGCRWPSSAPIYATFWVMILSPIPKLRDILCQNRPSALKKMYFHLSYKVMVNVNQ